MGRLELNEKLKEITPNVYFRPTTNIRMEYPCIVYNRSERNFKHADNKKYKSRQGYMVTVIEHDPDSELPDKVLELPYSSWNSEYVNDNLYHTVLTVYN